MKKQVRPAERAGAILQAKEERVQHQRRLLEQHPSCCLISLTLVIPGPDKIPPVAVEVFPIILKTVQAHLLRKGLAVVEAHQGQTPAGQEWLAVIQAGATQVKGELIRVEEHHPLGRLMDLDVLDASGSSLSRTQMGGTMRRCLLCGEAAHVCARAQTHNYPELLGAIEQMVGTYQLDLYADWLASLACKSMLYEVAVSPKPGLVDRFDSGAHQDMDVYTFLDSASRLTPEFRKFVMVGASCGKAVPQEAFAQARYLGEGAEDAMYQATGNVNTHKGLVFSLGLLCTALGWLWANGQRVETAQALLEFCRKMVSGTLSKELEGMTPAQAKTGGERCYAAKGHGGLREEACAGYPSVQKFGLPVLRQCLAEGMSMDQAGGQALLALMKHTHDSNIYARGGLRAEELVAQSLEDYTGEEMVTQEQLSDLNDLFVQRNISPGGSADLLALSFFLLFLFEQQPGPF